MRPAAAELAELKERLAEFVSHMGQADRICKPLQDSGVLAPEYQKSWLRLVNDAVELSQAIDKLSRAAGAARLEE